MDNFHRIAFGTKKHGHKYISESKLANFITILTELLFNRYEKNWYPENPDRGSGYRCIRVNTQCIDPTIKESMKRASINLPGELMASELTIWVDPGVVSVRIGEDGSIGSEIVDQEAYSKSKKRQTLDSPIKHSGSEDEDSASSRSSTPESRSSSGSVSPPLTFTSNLRYKSPSPVASEMEYNPYSPPTRVSYPQRYRQNLSPPSPPQSHSPSPQSVKNTSSPTRAFHSMAAASQARSPLTNTRGSPVSFTSHHGDFSQAGQSHIPATTHQRTMAYTRPRAIFPATSERDSQIEGLSKISFNPYSMPLNYERNMPAANFYDIPAMA